MQGVTSGVIGNTSGLRNLWRVCDFLCPRCVGEGEGGGDGGGGENVRLVMDGGVVEEIQQCGHLGNVVDCAAGVERRVRATATVPWREQKRVSRSAPIICFSSLVVSDCSHKATGRTMR